MTALPLSVPGELRIGGGGRGRWPGTAGGPAGGGPGLGLGPGGAGGRRGCPAAPRAGAALPARSRVAEPHGAAHEAGRRPAAPVAEDLVARADLLALELEDPGHVRAWPGAQQRKPCSRPAECT